MVESCIATIVGCIPATYTFWSQVVPASSLYIRLASAFSSQSSLSRKKQSGQSMSARISDNLKPIGSGGSSSTERINDHASDYHVHMPHNARHHSARDEYYVPDIPLNRFQQEAQHHV
jgi:hypothetical protein